MRREQEEDLARELETHLAIARDEQQERGLLPRDARHAAYKQFGNVTHVKEEMREMWGWTWLERIVLDVRYALRMMRRNPGFAAIAVRRSASCSPITIATTSAPQIWKPLGAAPHELDGAATISRASSA